MPITTPALVKAANDVADHLPLLDRQPYRQLARALPHTSSFLKAAALCFPAMTVAQRLTLGLKLAKHANADCGYNMSPGKDPLPTVSPMSFTGAPAEANAFAR